MRDKISKCPNCKSTNDGRVIYKCDKCGFLGCFRHHALMSNDGCWKGTACPICGADYKDTRIVARIG